jgi:hypothetical protein
LLHFIMVCSIGPVLRGEETWRGGFRYHKPNTLDSFAVQKSMKTRRQS